MHIDADPAPDRIPRRLSRRSVLALALLPIGARLAVLPPSVSGQPPPSTDCRSAPGVQLLVDLYRGTASIDALDLAIPAGWQIFFDADSGLRFHHPPDWELERWWAEQLLPSGQPLQLTQRPVQPIIAAARAASPDRTALFENAVAVVPVAPVSPAQGAELARLGVTTLPPSPICALVAPDAFSFSWFDAAVVAGTTIVTLGLITSATGPFTASSVIVWYSLVAPSAAFEAAVRAVFAPILAALIPGRETVPTPTPG